MPENNELWEQAWKKTCYLMSDNIPDKYVRELYQYTKQLPQKEVEYYVQIAQNWYDRKTLSKSSRIKITTNAVKLCLRLANEGVFTFPLIEKLATKGWDTAGGTYSFSMPLLTEIPRDIFSFGPIEKLIKKDSVLDIGNSYYGALEVDYKQKESKLLALLLDFCP